jgi:protein-S-isoprenylcysteine O-methyltransferase Ste14
MRGYLLVALQLLALAYLAITGPWLAPGIWIVPQIIGLGLGIWALAAMQLRNFHIAPEVRAQELVARGPYRWLRHPMYTAVLLIAGAWVGGYFSWARLIVWLLLAVVLVIKLQYEETLLQARFQDYASYRQRTKRLLPFVY